MQELKQLGVKVPTELDIMIRALAEKNGVTLAEAVRVAIYNTATDLLPSKGDTTEQRREKAIKFATLRSYTATLADFEEYGADEISTAGKR
jgi:hypothetical protein